MRRGVSFGNELTIVLNVMMNSNFPSTRRPCSVSTLLLYHSDILIVFDMMNVGDMALVARRGSYYEGRERKVGCQREYFERSA
jgi:hypothetical protein